MQTGLPDTRCEQCGGPRGIGGGLGLKERRDLNRKFNLISIEKMHARKREKNKPHETYVRARKETPTEKYEPEVITIEIMRKPRSNREKELEKQR